MGHRHKLGKYIHFYITNYLEEAASRVKFKRKECKQSTPSRNMQSPGGSRHHAEQFTGGNLTFWCLLAKIQKYFIPYCFKTTVSFLWISLPCVACAACSSVTVWDKSWAGTYPGHVAVLGDARRSFLPPGGFPVSILLIPRFSSLAVRIKNTMSVLIFKT